MSQRGPLVIGVLLLVLSLTLPTHAQVLGTGVLAVQEIGVQLYNSTVTAVNAVATALSTAATVVNQITDLTPVDEVITLQGILEDLYALADIVGQAEGLSYDVSQLQAQLAALFDLETAPNNVHVLNERLAQIRRIRAQCYSYAMRLQTLLTTATRTAEHLTTLLGSVATFLGAKQGMQTLVQVTTTISKTEAIAAAQVAAYQRAGSVDKMEELLTIESLHRINLDGCERCRTAR